MKRILTTVILMLLISALWVSLAAAEAGDADIEGQIIAVDDVEQTITVKTLDDEEFLVSFPVGFSFDFTLDDIGTYVHVVGEFLDDESILADTVEELEPVDIEGEVVSVDTDGRTITVKTENNEELLVRFPSDFEFGFTLEDVGIYVHIIGVYLGAGSILALSIEEIEPEDQGKSESAYCSGEKEKLHPVASKIASIFDATYEEVIGYFCDGFGFGQIILAYQTSKITGVDVAELLASREEGKGWGQIWKELGFKGKPKEDKEDKVPPGQQKKEDGSKDKEHPGKPDKDKDKDNNGKEKDKPKKDKKDKKEK